MELAGTATHAQIPSPFPRPPPAPHIALGVSPRRHCSCVGEDNHGSRLLRGPSTTSWKEIVEEVVVVEVNEVDAPGRSSDPLHRRLHRYKVEVEGGRRY